jgi:hypothetical protein
MCVSILPEAVLEKLVISLQSAIARLSPCNNVDFDDELVHLCNRSVQRGEPVAALGEKDFHALLVHLCNHAPLAVPLSLPEAVLLLIGRMALSVVTPVLPVPCAPCLLGCSLVLPVVGILSELFFVPRSLPGTLAVGTAAIPLLFDSRMGG